MITSAQQIFAARLRTFRRIGIPRILGAMWDALPPGGRVAFAGVVASAAIAVALGMFINVEIRRHLLDAEARGLQAAVAALAPSLPDLAGQPLSAAEIEATDRLVDRALLDADHVRVKLWSLDGVVLYSDARDLIGRHFPDVRASIDEVLAGGVKVEVTDLGDPENTLERVYDRLVEFYIPVPDESGQTLAVFEIYEDVTSMEGALSRITVATWLAIGSGVTVLLVFLVLLVMASVRSINRDRAVAEGRAEELAVLVGAAEALASSLEPPEFFARLAARVQRALGLSRISLEAAAHSKAGMFQHRLRDGSWLVAEREQQPLSHDDERILRAVANSLDAALANAALYAEVRDAALARQNLLRKIVEAHEDERRLLVGELHDTLAGELIRILYGIRGIAARGEAFTQEAREELVALEGLVGDAERELRAFMNRVRPMALDEVGLSAALQDAVARFGQETRVAVGVRMLGKPDLHTPEAQLVILRATEEGLLNVRKHAGATRVRVLVRSDDRAIRLSLDDDGVGWRPEGPAGEGRGLGLAYLRERVTGFGGTVRTERSRLGGARLTVEIPRSLG
ncbi:MAG: ATP-binding protein [Chloroflexota bacterium]